MFAILSKEFQYIVVLFALFVLPKILQRYHIPAAVTSVLMGIGAGIGLHLFDGDPTIQLLSVLGIVSLFLFAGLEINFVEVRSEAKIILQHLAIFSTKLLVVGIYFVITFQMSLRASLILTLALITPSAGFILASLNGSGLPDRDKFWIRSTAIATELLALAALFIILQSESVHLFTISTVSLIVMVVVLPLLFKLFANLVVPFAPNSEFAF